MARRFLDTSALVKLYRNEPLSGAVRARVGPDDTLIISGIANLEFQSAFFSLVRQSLIRPAHALQRVALLQKDLANFAVVGITQTLVESAEVLISQFGVNEGLRPADALQLACALEAKKQASLDSLLTTDIVLARCAIASGLVVKP